MLKKIEHILVIDDEQTCVYITELVLKKAGYGNKISSFNYGRQALDFLQKLDQNNEEFPELIFLDIKMPEFSGFDFLEEYHRLELDKTHNSSVVMCSSDSNEKTKTKAMKYNCVVDYIEKALKVDKYHKIVEKHFSKGEK